MFFFLIIFIFLVNPQNSLQFLIIAELLWILLYVITLLLGFELNNLNLVALTLFFLIFSAVEFAVGVLLVTMQFFFLRSIRWVDLTINTYLGTSRFIHRLRLLSSN